MARTPQSVMRRTGQAQHTIAGFRYQMLQSVLALLQLEGDDELLLEVSEDFSVVSDGEQTDVQVKNTQAVVRPPSYSLQSKVVVEAVLRIWESAGTQSRDTRRLIFLARGGSAHERGHSMPGGVTGIDYWQAAALDADTGPIRALLSDSMAGSGVADWLASNPTDDELRDRLLKRVSWQLDEKSSEAVRLVARDELRLMYRSMNLPVSTAEVAVAGLVDLVFEKASQPEEQDRRLTRLDLEAHLELFASNGLLVERRGRAAVLAATLLVSQPGTTAGVAKRKHTVEALTDDFRGKSLLWLYGAHGVGKSTLARLVAERLDGRWVVFDMWPVKDDLMGALAAWAEVAQLAMAGEIDGIILDNVMGKAGDEVLRRLAALRGTFMMAGGRTIVTSHHQPAPLALADLGASASLAAPYFSDADVEELVRQSPSPTEDLIKAWSLFVRLSSGLGHPTLVMSKLASLRARNWPSTALMEDFQSPSEATQLTREASRRKLLDELSELDNSLSLEARQILRRIASVYDRVDEKLVHRLAAQEPALRNVGDALVVLKGTWLEVLPLGDMRVSPLISDIGADVPVDESLRFKQLAAVHWLSLRTLDERTLPLCFWNSLWGRLDGVLVKLSETMQGLEADKFRAAAPMLSPITALHTDRSIYDGSPVAAIAVRGLQLAVAVALDNPEVATKAAERLLVELDELAAPYRVLLTAMNTFRVLLSDADLKPGLRVEYALKLRAALPMLGELTSEFPDPKRLLPPQLRADMDVSDFLVTKMVHTIRSSGGLVESIEAFDALDEHTRNRFLDAIGIMYGGLSVLANSGWAGDQLGDHDMASAYSAYLKAEAIVSDWGREDLMIEMTVARSVILDESLDRKDEALQLIDIVLSERGQIPTAIRQKARVLSHMGRHDESAELTLSVEDILSPTDLLERSLALRDGAVSLGKAKRFAEAARLFGKSRAVLSASDVRSPLQTGLRIEQGLALWRDGLQSEAVAVAADVLEELETYEVSASRQAERSHQYGRGLVGLFYGETGPGGPPVHPPFDFGQSSQIELDAAKLMSVDLPSLADNWRILASVEAELGGSALHARSMAKQGQQLSILLERDFQKARYRHAAKTGDVENAFDALVNVAHLIKVDAAPDDKFERADAKKFVPDDLDFQHPPSTQLLVSGTLDLLAYRVVLNDYRPAFQRKVASAYRAKFGNVDLISPILDGASQLFGASSPQSREGLLANGITLPSTRVHADAGARLYRDIMLLSHVEWSPFREDLIPLATSFVANGWLSLAAEMGGEFEAEISSTMAEANGRAERQCGEILLIAKEWVEHNFAEEWFELARRLVSGNFSKTLASA